MINCDFSNGLTCSTCGYIAKHAGIRRNCPKRPMPVRICRTGCQLSKLLHSFGFEYTPECSCESHAAEMDRHGTAWCRDNIDTITGWMREEAANRGLPFVEFAARQLVKLAIRRAEKETTT